MWLGDRSSAAWRILLARKRHHALILVALCLLGYVRVINAPFYFDDFPYVIHNPLIRDLGNYFRDIPRPENILEDTYNNFRMRPVSYISFSLNHLAHGTSPAGYHAVNIAIHAANTVLVYLLVAGIFMLAGQTAVTLALEWRARSVPLFTAALFAVHPVMTNAVTYVTQRMTSLATLFYLVTVILYTRYRLASLSGKPAKAWYLGALISCCTAMLTKEISLTLPLFIAAVDFGFCRGRLTSRLPRLVPFAVTAAIVPCLALGLTCSAGGNSSPFLSALNLVNFTGISPGDYFLTQLRVVVFYLRLMAVPHGLSLEHDFPLSRSVVDPGVPGSIALHAVVLGIAAVLLIRFRARSSPSDLLKYLAGFGIVWFYLTLSVESSIIPITEPAMEYRLYLPATGFLLFLVCMAHELADRRRAGIQSVPLTFRALTVLAALYLGMTAARNEIWRNPEIFWRQTIERYPLLGRPYANLADYYLAERKPEAAIGVYREAIGRLPGLEILHFELGNIYVQAGRYREGEQALLEAIRLDPGKREAYYSLAKAKCYLGKFDEARQILAEAETAGLDTATWLLKN